MKGSLCKVVTDYKNNDSWVDFKRVVWHSSFYEVLGTIHTLSKIGFHIKCADNVVHHVFPVILILSADYEEQYVCYTHYDSI